MEWIHAYQRGHVEAGIVPKYQSHFSTMVSYGTLRRQLRPALSLSIRVISVQWSLMVRSGDSYFLKLEYKQAWQRRCWS
jgi:hypothetical protein